MRLTTTVITPTNEGRYPVVILNHGAPQTAAHRKHHASYPVATHWFLARGTAVVIPNRRGYSTSGGGHVEHLGRCENPHYVQAGKRTAEDIASVVRWVRQRKWAQPDNLLFVGQSAGGWGALAVAGYRLPGVRALINFAGGRGSQGPNNNCAPHRLVQAARYFGRRASTATLFLYTQNDRAFAPPLSRALFDAYRHRSQAKTDYVLLPPHGQDGHTVFGASNGPQHWGASLESFLRDVPGMYCTE